MNRPIRALAAALLLALLAAAPGARHTANYGDRIDLKPTAVEAAALKALAETMPGRDGRPLDIDPRLIAAARDLARAIQNNLPRQEQILVGGVEKAMQCYGIYEPSYDAVSFGFGSGGDVIAQVRLRFSERKAQPMTNMGVGVAPPRSGQPVGIAVVLLVDCRARLDLFPRAVPCPSSWTLRGQLINSTRGLSPRVAMTLPGGEVREVSINRTRDSFSASIPFETPGVYRLEVAASGEGRVEMSALMLIRAGDAYGDGGTFEITGREDIPQSEQEAEDMMVDMINQVRQHEGLGIVLPDPDLTRLARAHSQDMRDNNFVGHASPSKGALADRVEAAGIRGYVAENVALHSSMVGGMNALLKSPLHRGSILSPKITRVGVGVLFDDTTGHRRYYITQEFGG